MKHRVIAIALAAVIGATAVLGCPTRAGAAAVIPITGGAAAAMFVIVQAVMDQQRNEYSRELLQERKGSPPVLRADDVGLEVALGTADGFQLTDAFAGRLQTALNGMDVQKKTR